ncbi:MAG: hypothetical protein BWY11_00997 [Firmicutes bacterium ADurb.Bin182]|nr:MAG: hypothetical protein BWY11_00997 [Firmicutes bacterium ADurb.Bin182]
MKRIAAFLLVLITTAGLRQTELTLLNMGYTDVFDSGGFADWPYEIVSE